VPFGTRGRLLVHRNFRARVWIRVDLMCRTTPADGARVQKWTIAPMTPPDATPKFEVRGSDTSITPIDAGSFLAKDSIFLGTATNAKTGGPDD